MIKYHTTKEGTKIALSDLELGHLKNIIAFYKKKAAEGIIVRSCGGSCAEDMWMDEEVVKGEAAEELLGLPSYEAELENRVGKKPLLDRVLEL